MVVLPSLPRPRPRTRPAREAESPRLAVALALPRLLLVPMADPEPVTPLLEAETDAEAELGEKDVLVPRLPRLLTVPILLPP